MKNILPIVEWIFSWEVTSVTVVAFVGIALAVLAMNDFRLAKTFFLFAGADAAGGIAMWISRAHGGLAVRCSLVFVTVGLIGVATILCLLYVDGKQRREDDPNRSNTGISEAREELNEVNGFICRKDENDLREEFDLPAMLKYNIEFAKRNLVPTMVSADESSAIDVFFLNGQARLDLRYAKVTTINHRVNVEWVSGKIGVVNTSKKYMDNRKILTRLMSSAAIPPGVTAALTLFDDAIEKNSAFMIESLNESLADDPRNILENSVYGADRYGSASGLYWSKFIPLRPKADVVTLAVRKAMESNAGDTVPFKQ